MEQVQPLSFLFNGLLTWQPLQKPQNGRFHLAFRSGISWQMLELKAADRSPHPVSSDRTQMVPLGNCPEDWTEIGQKLLS